MFSLEILMGYVGGLSYVGVIVALIIGGYILPIPEEAILILLGYFLHAGVFSPIPLFLTSFIGVLLHDQALYVLARRGSRYTTWFLQSMEQSPFLAREVLEERHVWRTLVVFRFLPYLRLAGPILAGSKKMRWEKFLLIDTSVLLVYTGVMLSIGYVFHGALESMLKKVAEVEHLVVLILFGITAGIIGWYTRHLFGFNRKKLR